MKLIVFALQIFSIITIIAQPTIQLSLYKQTNHFYLFCTQKDHPIADILVEDIESLFIQLSHDFQHTYTAPIMLYIYPDVQSLHQAMNWPTAPDWVIGQAYPHSMMIVSPENPGSHHSYASVMRAHHANLITLFMYDKFTNHVEIPRWLHQGVALYKAHMISQPTLHVLAQTSDLPTIGQLESCEKEDALAFDKLNGFVVSYSIVEFIDTEWGWSTILRLLADYSSFEEILKISKKNFRDQWIEFLKNK